MNHLNVRCPSCKKLYQINVGQIFSTSPQFACIECESHFTFDFPPADPADIATRKIERLASPVFESPKPRVKKCLKCGAESPEHSLECVSCHILFEKLEMIVNERGVRTQPSLVRRWKELVQDYANEEAHDEFLRLASEMDALEFAKQKYEQIRRLQGSDEVADRMLARIEALRAVRMEQKLKAKDEKEEDLALWLKIVLALPFFASLVLIVLGLSHAPWRNMIGTGIAIGLLSYGIIVAIRGRLHWRDLLP